MLPADILTRFIAAAGGFFDAHPALARILLAGVIAAAWLLGIALNRYAHRRPR